MVAVGRVPGQGSNRQTLLMSMPAVCKNPLSSLLRRQFNFMVSHLIQKHSSAKITGDLQLHGTRQLRQIFLSDSSFSFFFSLSLLIKKTKKDAPDQRPPWREMTPFCGPHFAKTFPWCFRTRDKEVKKRKQNKTKNSGLGGSCPFKITFAWFSAWSETM